MRSSAGVLLQVPFSSGITIAINKIDVCKIPVEVSAMISPPLAKKSKKAKKGEENTKTQAQKNDGLCATCNNQPSCAHNEARGHVLQCEEFDGYEPAKQKVDRFPMGDKTDASEYDSGEYIGLCVNCDNRRDCANAATEGGIWHCEEYR